MAITAGAPRGGVVEHYCPITKGAQVGSPVKMMKFQRKKEAEARQRQIATTIRYISCCLIAALSIGDFSLLYFFTEFLRGLK